MDVSKRHLYIGGSDAAACVGESPWKSRYDLWYEKVFNLIIPIENEAVKWGILLEDVVAQEFARRNGKKIRNAKKLYKHEKYPFLCGNIDRKVANESAVLEIKTTSQYNSDDWKESVPRHYYLQVLHYMMVTGYDKAYVAVLIGGQHYKQFEINRDESEINWLLEKELELWELVKTGTQPDITEASKIINYAYPNDNGTTIQLSDTESIERYIEIRDKMKELQDEQDFMQTLIKAEMQEAEMGIIGNYVVSWKTGKKNRTMRIKECVK